MDNDSQNIEQKKQMKGESGLRLIQIGDALIINLSAIKSVKREGGLVKISYGLNSGIDVNDESGAVWGLLTAMSTPLQAFPGFEKATFEPIGNDEDSTESEKVV